MYTENILKDCILFIKAFSSNQVARFFPKLYVALTKQTGRGVENTSIHEVANYFLKCVDDYQYQLGLNDEEFHQYLQGKIILEYGPGDILGVAFLLYAYGAEKITCVDRFYLSNISDKNIQVYNYLLNSLTNDERNRANNAFKVNGKPESGFNDDFIMYKVTENGLSGDVGKYNLVISRAVLEHVNNLDETIIDIKKSMKENGESIHQVDLKSHGLDRYLEFDFLSWPEYLYKLMYSHKGFPNRYRANKYKECAENNELNIKSIISTGKVDVKIIKNIYSKLDKRFKNIPLEELAWKGFWVHFE